MQDESDDDHEGEENIEGKRNRVVRKTGPRREVGRSNFRALVFESDTHCYDFYVRACVQPPVCGELKRLPNEPMYMRQGKAMTQKFLE